MTRKTPTIVTFAQVLHHRTHEIRPSSFISEPTPSTGQQRCAYETESDDDDDEEDGWRILDDDDETSEASTQPEVQEEEERSTSVSSSSEGREKEPDASMKSMANGRTAA